jgi:gamma-butyrobetaine dioxygenase
MTPEDPVDVIAGLFAREGTASYLGEPVTQAAHMLLCAALAERDGAADALVAAALLHDVGHLAGAGGGSNRARGAAEPAWETGNGHGQAGASWLSQWFGPEVTEPVRLHVDAKRYLCACVPGYAAGLSAASTRTLVLQGGPMQQSELADFEENPYAAAACRVRRWDDAAKDPAATPPPFEHFRPLLRRLIRSRARPGGSQPGRRAWK